jgi:protoheme IX farnesyltransferase
VKARDFAQLFKLPMSLMSTASAATGYLAFTHALSWRLLPMAGAILLLAFAACTLNEAQEYQLDARMERTRRRPIPTGKLSPFAAVILAALLAGLALLGLWLSGGWVAASLGTLALLWYNGLYTPPKRITSLASVVGSAIGAMPPAIGWICAGGTLTGPILSLSFFLLMWQVPHFWLLALQVSDDYDQARLPTIVRRMGVDSLSRITFMWTAATAASALLLPIFGLAQSPFLGLGLTLAGAWLTLVAWRSLRVPSSQGFRRAFRAINTYAAMIMAAVALDAILAR